MSTSPTLPVIQISPAPPEEPQAEPHSPFTPMNSGFGFLPPSSASDDDDDTYRPALLTPPVQSWTLSPRRPLSARPQGMGLKDEAFQALLHASKERSSAAAASRKHDLRKEVALKAHKNRQLERRALFLSKIGAPPSPTAISLPKTPPDSPAIFHYSLPSPGLYSPLAHFEKLGLDDQYSQERGVRKVWVEQVDFRLAKQQQQEYKSEWDSEEVPAPLRMEMPTPRITVTTPDCEEFRPPVPEKGHARKRSIPSLEQITERYSSQANTVIPASPTPTRPRARAPLPAFLNTRRSPPLPVEVPTVMITAAEPESEPQTVRPRLACTGRIQFPSRSPSPPSPTSTSKPLPALPVDFPNARRRAYAFPSPSPSRTRTPTPASPTTPTKMYPSALQITTTHVPRTESTSPVQLTEANLHALNSRTATAREMLSAIRRRTVIAGGSPLWNALAEEKQRRRRSAPADLQRVERMGFMHPVLALPGGF